MILAEALLAWKAAEVLGVLSLLIFGSAGLAFRFRCKGEARS